MFRVSVDLSSFRQQARRTVDALQDAALHAPRVAAQEGAAEAKRVGGWQNRTGRLRAGIVARFVRGSESSVTWEILSPTPYAKFIENGTRPHVIVPRNAKALRFVVNGQVVFAKKVNHPGTRAYPAMGPALLKAERVLYREFHVGIDKAKRLWG